MWGCEGSHRHVSRDTRGPPPCRVTPLRPHPRSKAKGPRQVSRVPGGVRWPGASPSPPPPNPRTVSGENSDPQAGGAARPTGTAGGFIPQVTPAPAAETRRTEQSRGDRSGDGGSQPPLSPRGQDCGVPVTRWGRTSVTPCAHGHTADGSLAQPGRAGSTHQCLEGRMLPMAVEC